MTACFLKLVFAQTGMARKTINPKINTGFEKCLLFFSLFFSLSVLLGYVFVDG